MSLIWGLQQQSHPKSSQICHLNTRHRTVEGVAWHGVRGHVCKPSINAIYGRHPICCQCDHGNRELHLCSHHTDECNKLTNRAHAVSASRLNSTQVFIACSRGGGWGGRGLQVRSSRWAISTYSLSPAPSVPVVLSFQATIFFGFHRSETKGLGRLKPLPCCEKHTLFKVSLHEFSFLPSIAKENIG